MTFKWSEFYCCAEEMSQSDICWRKFTSSWYVLHLWTLQESLSATVTMVWTERNLSRFACLNLNANEFGWNTFDDSHCTHILSIWSASNLSDISFENQLLEVRFVWFSEPGQTTKTHGTKRTQLLRWSDLSMLRATFRLLEVLPWAVQRILNHTGFHLGLNPLLKNSSLIVTPPNVVAVVAAVSVVVVAAVAVVCSWFYPDILNIREQCRVCGSRPQSPWNHAHPVWNSKDCHPRSWNIHVYGRPGPGNLLQRRGLGVWRWWTHSIWVPTPWEAFRTIATRFLSDLIKYRRWTNGAVLSCCCYCLRRGSWPLICWGVCCGPTSRRSRSRRKRRALPRRDGRWGSWGGSR